MKRETEYGGDEDRKKRKMRRRGKKRRIEGRIELMCGVFFPRWASCSQLQFLPLLLSNNHNPSNLH